MYWRNVDMGPVDAYAIAVEEGFTGTRAEWVAAMQNAEENGLKAEAYATGKRNGTDVADDDPAYQNNALYYAEQAGEFATAADGSATEAAGSAAAAETAKAYAQAFTGAPRMATTVAGMTDHDLIYVYLGSEDGYTSGNWYYWDGEAWTSGGVYNSSALTTDKTLLVSGAAADSKVAGDKIKELKNGFTECILNNSNKSLGNEWYIFKSGVCRTGSSASQGQTVYYEANENYVTTGFIPCSQGDVFNIHVYGSSSSRRAYFECDADKKVLYYGAASTEYSTPYTIQSENARYIVFNDLLTNLSSGYYAYKGAGINDRLNKGLKDLTDTTDCVRKNLIPYACNKSGSGSNLTASQNGNDITISGTSTASEGQSATKISITDHIEMWNASEAPESAVINTIELLKDHTYKLSCKIISGTRDKGEGAGGISVRIYQGYIDKLIVAVAIDETEKSGEYVSTGENIRLQINIGRLLTVANLVLRISLEDITDAKAISNEIAARSQFEDVMALVTGNRLIDNWDVGHWYRTADGVVDIDSPVARSESACIYVECSKGDRFTITGCGGTSNYSLYAFIDSEGNIIAKAKSRTTVENAAVTAPENSAYLIVNTQDNTRPYSLYKGEFVDARLNALESDGDLVIPEYYYEDDYLTNKINGILEKNLSIDGDNFVFITDYHAHKNAGHSPAIINKIYEQTGITKLFCGGDIGTSTGLGSTKTNAKAMKTLQSVMPNLYACVGNHEWKVSDSSYAAGTYNTVYNYYINQMEPKCSDMSGFGDYWIDSKGAKIRYFFLNQNVSPMLTDISLKWFMSELPNVPEGYGIVVVMHHAYHSKTYNTASSRKSFGMLNWWDNVVGQRNLTVRRISQIMNAVRTGETVKYALRPYDSTLKKEQNITPRDHTTAEKNSCGDYDPLLSTFAAGTNTGAWTDIVTFDGSSMNTGVYPIAIFCGHKHEDAAYDPASAASLEDMTDEDTVYLLNGTWYRYDNDPESETYEQRVPMLSAAGASSLSQTETVPPILVILTTTDCYALNHPDIDPTVREYDSISEQAFDIVQIDTKARKVYCTRIGAGSDREFSF